MGFRLTGVSRRSTYTAKMDQLDRSAEEIITRLADPAITRGSLDDLLEGVVTTTKGKALLGKRLASIPTGESSLRRLAALAGSPHLAVHLTEVDGERQAAILRRDAILSALLTNTATIVVGLEPNGRIGFCNAAATDATGLVTGDSIITFASSFNQEELNRVLGEFAQGADRAHWSVELDTASAGMRSFDFSMIANRVDDDVVSFSVIGYDVTELRAVERALDEGRAFLQMVLDASPDVIQFTDPEGRMVLMNAAAKALFPEPEQRRLYALDGRPLEPSEFPSRLALATGEPVFARVLTETAAGARRLWEAHARPTYADSGELLGSVTVSRDMTEAAELTAADVERQSFIRSLLRSTADAVVAVDISLNVQYVNPRAAEFFGYLAEGSSILDAPSDIVAVDGAAPSPENLPLERALRGEENVVVELEVRGPDQRLILAGLTNPIRDADGDVTGAVGVYRDVTEQQRATRREAARIQFTLQMLDSMSEPLAALNVLTDEEYLNSAARSLGIPGPGSDLPLPFTRPDGSPLDEGILFEAMSGRPRERFEMVHKETGRVFVASARGIETEDGVLGGVLTARDITELREAFQQLEVQSAAMDATITAMFITDVEGTIEWVNTAFTNLTGYSAEEAIGENPRILKSGVQPPEHFTEMWQTILSGRPWQGRLTNRTADGRNVVVDLWVTPVVDENGDITHFVAVQDDVTSEVEAEEIILHMATHDALTDLPNRRLFLEHLDQAIARAERSNGSLGVLMLDLDKFKDVNDALGHPAGDTLLREVAKRLLSRVRGTDVVARLGGDEFAIIVDDADLEGTRIVARDIIVALSREFQILRHEVRSGTTIGLAMYSPGTTAEQLLDRADLALYAAKDKERGTLEVYVPEMGEQTRQRAEMAAELRRAIANEELTLDYQPIFDIDSGSVTSIEALVRWVREDGSILYPASFLGAAAESGLLPSLGRWVLDAVCSQASAWAREGRSPPPIAINVSPQELRSKGWGRLLSQALTRARIGPSALAIEVTEAGLLVAADDNLAMLTDLRARGLHLTLDDFGTGASSLQHFRRLPVDRIKIDRLFVHDVNREVSSGAIVQASALLADSVGAKLVAKGAESVEQLSAVRRLGAQEAQGFVLERPLEASEIAALFHVDHPILSAGLPD